MVKAVFFDLDDTLLWDQKSVKEAFVATCEVAKEKYGVDIEEFEEAVRKEARELYASYETYEFTQMIGINPFEGLWGNFLDDTDDFRKMAGLFRHIVKKLGLVGLRLLVLRMRRLEPSLLNDSRRSVVKSHLSMTKLLRC